MPKQLYIVFCREHDEDPPGIITRSVLAEDDYEARQIVDAYHETLDGDFRTIDAFTPATLLEFVADVISRKPDIP
jgi:hypothetical protein